MYGINEATRDARIHMLTPTEEVRLHADYVAGDHAAGRRLVVGFLPVIRRSAYAYGMPRGHGRDLLGVAVQAFLENLHRFDPSKGYRLWTYMRKPVAHSVSAYAAANRSFFRITSVRERVAFTFLEKEKKRIEASGRALTDSETRLLAARFGVCRTIIHGMDDDMSVMKPASLRHDRTEEHGMEDPERVGGHLDFEREHDHDRLIRLLKPAMGQLDERKRQIIERRFKGEPDTLEDISADLGVSRERVRQIEGIALRLLRHAMENPGAAQTSHASLLRRYDGDVPRGASKYVPTTRRGGETAKPRRRAKGASARPGAPDREHPMRRRIP